MCPEHVQNGGGRTMRSKPFCIWFFLQNVNFFANINIGSLREVWRDNKIREEELVKDWQTINNKQEQKWPNYMKKINSPVNFPLFKWVKFGTNDYFKAIDEINDVYRKVLMIGEAKKVFCDKVCPMMTAKTKDEFKKACRSLNEKYWKYTRTSKATLPKISVDVVFVPDPRKYRGTPGQRLPTLREIIAKERILEFKNYMENLNMFTCSQFRECHIKSKSVTDKLTYEFKSCKKTWRAWLLHQE